MPNNLTDYRSSGVDIQAGEATVLAIKDLVKQTYNSNVLSELGSFGGLYRFPLENGQEPIIVASTDGVGTKLLVAIKAGRYNTIGQDLVNHCVNDILVQGANPLFFLDYVGLGKLEPDIVQQIISGMVTACRENSCALIGGEMAEMPGIYGDKDFDLVGTIVGVVEHRHLLPADRIREGDILVGLPSSGLHTNGYSLVRKVIFEQLKLDLDSYIPDLGSTVGEALLQIHTSYLPTLKQFLLHSGLHGLAHITGGGIPGNLKRIIPEGLTACVFYPENQIPPLFQWLRNSANLSWETMLEAFNLGVGMIAVLDPAFVSEFLDTTQARILGKITKAASPDAKVIFSTSR